MSSRSKSTKKKEKKKYITKTIKVNSPYVADGVIKRKLFNPAYVNDILGRELRVKFKGSEDYAPPFVKPLVSPYEAVSCSPKRNPFPNIKSKYMADVTNSLAARVGSQQNNYVVGKFESV